MSTGRLTDDELRAAAARRPGYATYPEYRPGQRERLGRLPAVGIAPALTLTTARKMSDDDARAVKDAVREGIRRAAHVVPAGLMIDARPPAPAAPPAAESLASLPAARVFEFEPYLVADRPWWRRRWHWGVIAARGGLEFGYVWTEAGARRRTARAARRAAR